MVASFVICFTNAVLSFTCVVPAIIPAIGQKNDDLCVSLSIVSLDIQMTGL